MIEDSLLRLSTATASNAFFRHLPTPPDSSAHLRSIPKYHLPQIQSTISGNRALEEIPRHQSKLFTIQYTYMIYFNKDAWKFHMSDSVKSNQHLLSSNTPYLILNLLQPLFWIVFVAF
uniref:Uncharacterized protein n=1 Tax=Brassica oleracea TaxID=3712 RepID=A0A3P6AID0_BRAOL|nr:unnamed protein product [Brassica oleracea]